MVSLLYIFNVWNLLNFIEIFLLNLKIAWNFSIELIYCIEFMVATTQGNSGNSGKLRELILTQGNSGNFEIMVENSGNFEILVQNSGKSYRNFVWNRDV